MTGWATIKKIREFEERAARLGFAIQQPSEFTQSYTGNNITSSYRSVWIDEMSSEGISLTPIDNRYPNWRRGSSVFSGSIEEAKFFFQGIEFAHISDQYIGMSSEKKRATFENKYVERIKRLEEAKKKRAEQKKVWDILKHGKAMEEDEEVPF